MGVQIHIVFPAARRIDVEGHRTLAASQDLHADQRLKKTLLPHRREAWLLIQSHLKGNRGARAVIEWIRMVFQTASSL
jgi:hypothetical protein